MLNTLGYFFILGIDEIRTPEKGREEESPKICRVSISFKAYSADKNSSSFRTEKDNKIRFRF